MFKDSSYGKMAYTPSPLPLCVRVFIDALIFLAAAGGMGVLYTLVEPHKRGFFCDDQTIQYPYQGDTVRASHLLLVGGAAPMIAIIGLEVIFRLLMGRRRSPKDFALTTCKLLGMFLYGQIIVNLITALIKFYVGRLRPHFIHTCQPDFSKINCTQGYITDFECTSQASEDELWQARTSFPSGHSSLAFYSAIYLVMYVEERLEIAFSTLLKSLIQMALVMAAAFCAISRVTDHRHHPEDVLAGAIIGVVVALWLIFWVGPHTRRESPIPRVNRAADWRGGESVVLTDAINQSPIELKPPPGPRRSPTNGMPPSSPRTPNHVTLTERRQTQALLRPHTPQ